MAPRLTYLDDCLHCLRKSQPLEALDLRHDHRRFVEGILDLLGSERHRRRRHAMNFVLAVGVHALVLRISSHCRLQQGGKEKETVPSHI